MKLVIQRVKHARLTVDGEETATIGQGLLILVGVSRTDTGDEIAKLARKTAEMRIFSDEEGRMNRSLLDIGGEALVVSQFTLYADCSHGRRPDFLNAAHPDRANALYEDYVRLLIEQGVRAQTGVFGAHMEITLLNDGPVTIILEMP
jgi:D-tyrosyl-tRNA(Tyr) deacylase